MQLDTTPVHIREVRIQRILRTVRPLSASKRLLVLSSVRVGVHDDLDPRVLKPLTDGRQLGWMAEELDDEGDDGTPALTQRRRAAHNALQ